MSNVKRIGGIKHGTGQMAGLYDLGETLGHGHYAVVKMARHVFTGERVAVKVIDKHKLDAATRLQMLQEVRLMKLVQHPYVVRLYEVIDTQSKLYLVLEFADGGDMYDYIMRHEGGLAEAQAKKYFRQIVTAIHYCHKLHVVHRDLKPENVVFFEKLGLVKLTDFGFSNKFNPGQRLKTSCGSLAYSAPEILLGDAYDAPAVDVWSLGVILYMLVCGTAPFQEANDSETLTMIMDCKYTFPLHISQQCRDLISLMLRRNPERRANLDDIVNHPWLYGTSDSDPKLNFPLVTKQHLSEEDHSLIIQKMVNGGIGEQEEIFQSLDKNDYNHITATYFLLAERKLRLLRQKEQHVRRQVTLKSVSSPIPTVTSHLSEKSNDDVTKSSQNIICSAAPNISISTASSSMPVTFRKTFGPCTLRKNNYSIVEEEEEDEIDTSSEVQLMKLDVPVDGEDDDEIMNIFPKRMSLSRHSSSTSSLIEKVTSQHETIQLNSVLDLDLSSAIRSATGYNRAGSSGTCSECESDISVPAPFPLCSQIGTGNLSRQGSLRRSGSPSPITPPSPSTSVLAHVRALSLHHPIPPIGRKLATTRSSPQLLLNQIHEETEEALDSFLTSSTAASVVKLDQRRIRRFHRGRTVSCSSSDASDDEPELLKKKKQLLQKTVNHDSDTSNEYTTHSSRKNRSLQIKQRTTVDEEVATVRSRSLNRISELHVSDFSLSHPNTDEHQSPPCIMLGRYLESLSKKQILPEDVAKSDEQDDNDDSETEQNEIQFQVFTGLSKQSCGAVQKASKCSGKNSNQSIVRTSSYSSFRQRQASPSIPIRAHSCSSLVGICDSRSVIWSGMLALMTNAAKGRRCSDTSTRHLTLASTSLTLR